MCSEYKRRCKLYETRTCIEPAGQAHDSMFNRWENLPEPLLQQLRSDGYMDASDGSAAMAADDNVPPTTQKAGKKRAADL